MDAFQHRTRKDGEDADKPWWEEGEAKVEIAVTMNQSHYP